jgi:hypothetical protein
MSVFGFLSVLVAGLSPVALVVYLTHALRRELAAHRDFLAAHQSVGGRPIDVIEAEFQLQRDKLALERERLVTMAGMNKNRPGNLIDPGS